MSITLAMTVLGCFAATAFADNPIDPQPGAYKTVCKNFTYTKTSHGIVFKHVFHEVVLQVQMVTPVCYNGFTLAAQPSTCHVLQEGRNISVDGCNSSGVAGRYSSLAYPPFNGIANSGYHAEITFNVTECVFLVHLICLPARTVTLNEDFDALGNSHKYAINA